MSRLSYRFGDCTVDPSARELRRGGVLATLSPKVFDCLIYLIEHRDRAVGRDELIAAVWGKLDVTDTLLGQTVLKARRAVGDSGDGQNAIRTIPRFGYRWIAEIESVPIEAVSADGSIAPTGEPSDAMADPTIENKLRDVRAPRWLWPALAFAAVAIAMLWFATHRETVPPLPQNAEMVAADAAVVLPVDVTAGADWAWVRLGLMDLVAGRLRAGGQAVVPSDNVVALTGKSGIVAGNAAERVREATRARYLVTIHAAQEAGGWTVRVQLDDHGTPRNVETHNADVIAAGRAASDRLLALLGRQVPDASSESLGLSSAQILQRAEAALLTEDVDEARRLLETAPPAVRDSPEARIRLAHIDLRAGKFAAARDRLGAVLTDLPAETEPVLRARALIVLGSVEIRTDHFDASESAFAEAVSILENRREPDVLGQAYTGRGVTAAAQGHYEAALADFSRARIALELAGNGLALARVEANEGLLEATRNRYAEALPIMQRAEQRFETFGAINERVTLLCGEIDAHLDLLDPAQALAASERAWPLVGRLQSARIQHALKLARARALAANGRLTEARALLAELVREADTEIEKMPIARAQAEQARLDLAGGETATARALAESAVNQLTGADDIRTRSATWLVMLRALRASKDDTKAAERLAGLAAWSEESTSPVAKLYATLGRAEQSWADRQREASRAAYAEALRMANENSAPVDLAEVIVSYASTLIADGELESAGALVGQVARWVDSDFACAVLQLRFYQALQQEDAWRAALTRAKALAGERAIPPSLRNFSIGS